MATTYPTIVYGEDSNITTQPRLLGTNLEMGDGYQWVIGDGKNYLPRFVTLVHPLIDDATASTLKTFLRANANGTVVTIKNLMEDPSGAETLNVVILGWNRESDGITHTYTVNFREVFRT